MQFSGLCSRDWPRLVKMQNITEKFRQYFESHGFVWQPGTVICSENPKLLFNISGGVRFEQAIDSAVQQWPSRIASSQKCLRTDNWVKIGQSGRHHFAFEMLGHFCLYEFNEQATKQLMLETAWGFLTVTLGLPSSSLVVIVHPDDVTSRNIWRQIGVGNIREDIANINVSASHNKSGFRTEIAWFAPIEQSEPSGKLVELWNIVFTEFEGPEVMKQRMPIIAADSGMCLDRVLTAVELAASDYSNSLWKPLVQQLESCGFKQPIANRLADVGRAITWLVTEDLEPGNKAAGYVLRKFIRESFALCSYESITFDDVADLWLSHWLENSAMDLTAYKHVLVIGREVEQFRHALRAGERACARILKKGKLTEEDLHFLSDTHGYPEALARRQQQRSHNET